MPPSILGALLTLYRDHYSLTIRQLADQIGISHATLSRIERGLPYDMVTAKKLFTWLEGPASRGVLGARVPGRVPAVPRS